MRSRLVREPAEQVDRHIIGTVDQILNVWERERRYGDVADERVHRPLVGFIDADQVLVQLLAGRSPVNTISSGGSCWSANRLATSRIFTGSPMSSTST